MEQSDKHIMNDNHPLSILVIGAGAIGGITAALLHRKGYNVTIVAKYPDYASKISEEGLHISGIMGSYKIKVPAVAAVEEIHEKQDVILVATKASDMSGVASAALPLLKERGYMVSMQNGICEYELASVAGVKRTVGCVVGWGATMSAPGEMMMTSKGDFIIGYTDREPDDDLKTIAEALSSVVPVTCTDNILGHRYSKLIINSCITSMGAICGLYLGQMLARKAMRRIFINIIFEAVAVADAIGLHIEVFGGRLDFYRFVEKSGLLADIKRDLTIRVIGFKYRRLKSSSLQSLERGKPTEVEYLNGFVVSKADEHGVDVPVNRKITEMIRQIESGKRSISPDNFNDPVFK